MPAMKCPGPQCTFLFDPAKVPPGAVLVCPRCAMRFTIGPTAPAAPPAGYGVPAGYPATANFDPGDVPGLPSDGQPTLAYGGHGVATPGPVAPPAPPDAPNPPRRKSSGLTSTLLTVLGVIALLTFAVGAVVLVAVSKRGVTVPAAAGDSEVRVPDRNFAYRMPGSGWVKDNDTQNELGVNVFALRRDGTPAAWVALAVIDYETRNPPAGELHEETLRHLNRVFQDVPQALATEPAKWGPHEARKCFFRAEHKGTQVACVGDAYAMSHKGVGYWFYAWAAEADAATLAGEFDGLRERLRTLDQREKWVAAVAVGATFRSVKPSSRFRLTTPEAIWAAPQLEPTDEDPAAELLLKGVLKSRVRRDFNPEALVVVVVVPGTAEPAEVAEEYVRKRHTRDPNVFGPTAITEVTGDVVGDGPADAAGGLPARRFKVSPGGPDASKVAEKLVVFAAMKSGDSVVVAEANCPWSQKDVWERRLVQFVGSLRP